MSAVYQEIRALIYLALSVMSGLSLTSYQQPDLVYAPYSHKCTSIE